MILIVLRTLFVLLMAAVGWFYVGNRTPMWGDNTWLAIHVALAIGVFFVCVDMLSPRKKLAVFSGTFFGLVVGIIISLALSFAVKLIVEQLTASQFVTKEIPFDVTQRRDQFIRYVDMLTGVVSCYLAISFVLQTKDDFRFIIPYVEFSKNTKGARPVLLDTSVLIDGRIADIADTCIIESQMIVPRFVLNELQIIADSSDKLKRNRGRRGLDVLQQLQNNKKLEVILYDSSARHNDADTDVDSRLMTLATELNARVLTNDFNLNKIAGLRGVIVININDLATALKPVVLAGEKMTVRLLKQGEEAGQGVGYLEDGTMVVVEQGRSHVNEEVEFTVTSVLQTSAGKMIFGRMGGDGALRRGVRGRGDASEPAAPSPTA